MKSQASEGIQDYLAATDFCDSDSQAIKSKAKMLTDNAESPREAAERIFYFVRDEILFGLDRRDVKASQTLQKGFGFCVTKTNAYLHKLA
jgi:transglutaminase-like putative cysteine protease